MTIEAIKLVELLSSLNIEDFQMNQWIFLIDGYGMKLQTKQSASLKKKDADDALAMMQKKVNSKAKATDENMEVFKTFIVKFIGDQEYSFYNVDDPQVGKPDRQMLEAKEESSFKSRNPQSSMGDINSTNPSGFQVSEVTRLQEQAASLQQSINDSNVIGNEFNRQEAEAKIEIDFLINDEMLQTKN